MPVNQEANVKTLQGQNFSAIYCGPLDELDTFELEVPSIKRKAKGKLFVKELLGLSSMQISMNKLPPGRSVPFYHQHKENEECYLFIKGSGQMQVDGELFEVEEGTLVRISTAGSRTLRNNGSEDLYFICIQAKENSLNIDTFEDGIKSDVPVQWPD
ncbi:MAG: cupin domain-containing protein [Cyanobacteria bacterium]|nr:cupin domain-containing protein [Cyanobacteriota bacterium]